MKYIVFEKRPWNPVAAKLRESKSRAAAESFAADWKKKYPKHTIWIELAKEPS